MNPRHFADTHKLLTAAAQIDTFSPIAPNLNARLYMQQYHESAGSQPQLLDHAIDCLDEAIQRNPASFQYYQNLSLAYDLIAQNEDSAVMKNQWETRAYDTALLAAQRYPGSGKIQLELARISEQLEDNHKALEHYKKAVAIEDGYRQQFKKMYPGREMFSRLGEQQYRFAKQRIAQLTNP